MAKGKKNNLTRRSPRKWFKKKKRKKKESLTTDSLVKEDLSNVPKRSAHNRKQSLLSTKQSKTTKKNSWVDKDLS